MPNVAIAPATAIWTEHTHWALYSHCCIWNPRHRKVDIWECICAHDSTPDTQPPDERFWRFLARR